MNNILDNKMVVPNRVWLSLTGLCNNACEWCYRSGSETPRFLDTELATLAIKTLSKCGTKKCTIIGGEPTLHKDYKTIINSATKEMSSCTLVTNGRLLSLDFPDEWSNNKKFHVIVSLHGVDPEHYQLNTKSRDGFDQTTAAIKLLVSKGVRHSVNVVISRENIPKMYDFVRIVSELKVARLCFTIAISSMDNPDYVTDPLELANAVPKIHEMCQILEQSHLFIFSLPWCLLSDQLSSKLITNRQLIFNCPIDQGKGVVVKEDGALTVCTHLSSYEVVSSSKARLILSEARDFLEFWNSSEISDFRHATNVYRYRGCTACFHRLYCKGGCPLWWKSFDFRPILKERR